MPRKFRSHRTDMRKRSKYPVQRKRMTEKERRAKAEARAIKRAKQQIGAATAHSGYKATRKANHVLGIQTQCQCMTNGIKIWAKVRDKNGNVKRKPDGKPVVYPAIVGPKGPDGEYSEAVRCPDNAVTSKRRGQQTEHRCAKHVGVWYVDPDGNKHDHDDNVIG